MITSTLVVRYICIFHLKNALLANDEYWHMFINLWVFFAIIITNGVNWFLPGLYTHTYEMCTCTAQDYNQQPKYEGTALFLTLVTMIVYAFVSVRIKVYNYKTKAVVYPAENTILAKKKLIADLTLTIRPAFLVTVTFLVSLVMGRTRTGIPYNQYPYYLVIYMQYLIAVPIIVAIFVFLFYSNNKHVKTVLQREWNNHGI